MTFRPIRRALLSVHDKAGLVDFARGLAEKGVELVSTGGTAAAMRDAGLPVVEVSTVSGAPQGFRPRRSGRSGISIQASGAIAAATAAMAKTTGRQPYASATAA